MPTMNSIQSRSWVERASSSVSNIARTGFFAANALLQIGKIAARTLGATTFE